MVGRLTVGTLERFYCLDRLHRPCVRRLGELSFLQRHEKRKLVRLRLLARCRLSSPGRFPPESSKKTITPGRQPATRPESCVPPVRIPNAGRMLPNPDEDRRWPVLQKAAGRGPAPNRVGWQRPIPAQPNRRRMLAPPPPPSAAHRPAQRARHRVIPRATTHKAQAVLPTSPAGSQTGKPATAVRRMSPWLSR